jgi:hypothetical protein
MTLVLSGNTGSALDGIKNSLMFLETAKATTSGTSIDFTGIPSWAKKITVMFNDVSTNGTSPSQIQLGTSSGIDATSYKSTASNQAGTTSTSTTGLLITDSTIIATATTSGLCVIALLGSNIWVSNSVVVNTTAANLRYSGGVKTLSGTLDRVRITTVNGTDTFDAGSINILIEGYV